jgi:hypothetical protein
MRVTTCFAFGTAEMYPFLFSLFLFLLHFNNFTAFVKAAVGTDGVRKAHGTAVGTCSQVARHQSIMCAAHVAAALGMFALWMWGHSFSLITFVRMDDMPIRTGFANQAGRL